MIENLNIPNHVGIIMDGNGRWAKERGMIRTMGHKNAVKTLKKLLSYKTYEKNTEEFEKLFNYIKEEYSNLNITEYEFKNIFHKIIGVNTLL